MRALAPESNPKGVKLTFVGLVLAIILLYVISHPKPIIEARLPDGSRVPIQVVGQADTPLALPSTGYFGEAFESLHPRRTWYWTTPWKRLNLSGLTLEF